MSMTSLTWWHRYFDCADQKKHLPQYTYHNRVTRPQVISLDCGSELATRKVRTRAASRIGDLRGGILHGHGDPLHESSIPMSDGAHANNRSDATMSFQRMASTHSSRSLSRIDCHKQEGVLEITERDLDIRASNREIAFLRFELDLAASASNSDYRTGIFAEPVM